MIIYEVNLKIKAEIFSDFMLWLEPHVEEILTYPGFIKAIYLKDLNINDIGIKNLSIQYYLTAKQYLDNYLENHAEAMRADGLIKFPNQFSSTRRFLSIEVEKESYLPSMTCLGDTKNLINE